MKKSVAFVAVSAILSMSTELDSLKFDESNPSSRMHGLKDRELELQRLIITLAQPDQRESLQQALQKQSFEDLSDSERDLLSGTVREGNSEDGGSVESNLLVDPNTVGQTPILKPTELYVLLSDLCNFSCAHCLSSSGPTAKAMRMSADEVGRLADTINDDPRITSINFSGGEPTLQIPLIQALQGRLKKKVAFNVTTNGWLGKRVSSFIRDVQVDSFTLSYDRWHKPFVTEEVLVDFVATSIQFGKPVELNVVYEDFLDLSMAEKLTAAGAKLNANRLISCGKAKDLPSESPAEAAAWSGTCPSLEAVRGDSDVQKLIYFPQKGFSICCGPLSFDQLIEEDDLFAVSPQQVPKTEIYRLASAGSFAEQAKAAGLAISSSPKTRCEACAFLHAKRKAIGVPSLWELATQVSDVGYYPTLGRLNSDDERALSDGFHVGYFLLASAEDLKNALGSANESLSASIVCSDIRNEGAGVFTEFTERTFYDRFENQYGGLDRDFFRQQVDKYFHVPLFGRVYRKDGRAVALISTHVARAHAATGSDLLHIGYAGYDRSELTQDEVRWIKSDWFRSLCKWSLENGGLTIDCSVDFFNDNAFRLTGRAGFKLHSVRLDRRPRA